MLGQAAVEVVHDKRPSALAYVVQVLRYLFTPTFFREIARLSAFYAINHVKGISKIHRGQGARIWPTVLLRNAERIYIGDNTAINHNNILWAGRRSACIRIGRDVMTGPSVHMIAYNHHVENGRPLREEFVDRDIIVEDNVWIGAGVVILAGARIGEGCVVGAGAVVTGELPPHSVCVGVPARVVKTLRPGPARGEGDSASCASLC